MRDISDILSVSSCVKEKLMNPFHQISVADVIPEAVVTLETHRLFMLVEAARGCGFRGDAVFNELCLS